MDQEKAPRPSSLPPSVPAKEEPAPSEEASRAEPAFNLPAAVVVAILLCAGVHLVRTQFLNADQNFDLILRAAFIPLRYTGGYDLDVFAFSSPVTYSLLHGDIVHLGVNVVWLAAFGSPLAGRLGNARFALFWAVTAVAAALLFFLLHPDGPAPLVGASGAISGMMGAAARFGFRIDRRHGPARFLGPPLSVAQALRRREVLTFLAVWFAVNLVTGLLGTVPGAEGQIAWEAHIGGFLAGFFGLPALLGGRRRDA